MAGFEQSLNILKRHSGSDLVCRRKNVGVAIGSTEDVNSVADLVFGLLRSVIFQALIVHATAEGDLASKTAAHFIDVQGSGLHRIEYVHAKINEFWKIGRASCRERV